MFQESCGRREEYVTQLNRSLGRATMNLSWKNRFLESRDAVISQFRELSVILEEFSRQIDGARDVSQEYEYILKKWLKRYHISLGRLLLLEYENGQREAFLTVRTTNGRCITSKEAAEITRDADGGGQMDSGEGQPHHHYETVWNRSSCGGGGVL